MRITKFLYLSALVATSLIGAVMGQSAGIWKVGVQYKAGQTVTYQGATYKVLVNHLSQADWYPGCCGALWEIVTGSQGAAPTAVQSVVTVPPPTTGWPARVFAPYTDILLWPTLDVTKVALATGVKHYTLAFLISDANNNPAWGGMTPLDQGFYADYINGIRKLGGDVIISFGGANGQEIALTNTDVNVLQAKYEAAIVKYNITAIDFDVEGGAVLDTASIDRRNKAIAGFQKKYPTIRTSYTLPVMPTGLDDTSVGILSNAKKNGARVDVVNLMTMDYGSGAAPQGGTQMGTYAISAAQATYKQAVAAYGSTIKIGICPMIGQNDVAGEVFRVVDATQVVNWALANSWVNHLAMWSINRDTATTGPLYASSKITQKDYDFAKAFVKFTSAGATVATTVLPKPTTTAKPPTTTQAPTATTSKTYVVGTLPALRPVALTRLQARGAEIVDDIVHDSLNFVQGLTGIFSSVWKDRTFAPYVDLTAQPPFDFQTIGEKYGIHHYTLAFVAADESGNPTWGGAYPIPLVNTTTSDPITDRITALRSIGGDIIISFSSATSPSGTHLPDLAQYHKDVPTLQKAYQAVVDKFQATWIDFVIQDEDLTDVESIKRRNEAVVGLKKANGKLRVGYTVPAEAGGLGGSGKQLVDSVGESGLDLDVLNLITIDLHPTKPIVDAIITAALGTYHYLQTTGHNTRIGLTPFIGKNPSSDEIFNVQDAFQLVQWARTVPFVAKLSYWSANRDRDGDLEDGGSGISQGDLSFGQALAVFDD